MQLEASQQLLYPLATSGADATLEFWPSCSWRCASWLQHLQACSLTEDRPAAVQLVVVSPLRRTLETASGVFGVDGATDGQPLLMQGQQGVRHEISPHAALSAPAGLPFLAHEGCRERVGGLRLRVCASLSTLCIA